MKQMARNVMMEGYGMPRNCRYPLYDRDTKYTQSFRAIIASGRVEPLALLARSPNLNAYAERWVRSVKEECLSNVVLIGERSLRRAPQRLCRTFPCRAELSGEGQCPAVPSRSDVHRNGLVQCRERLGGLPRYYHQESA